MIQDVKPGIHYICMPSTSVCSCSAFISKCRILFKIKLGVERGVATRMAQGVWTMMIVTATNFVGFTRQQF